MVAPRTSKRRRSAVGQKEVLPPPKRTNQLEDEEILSDEVDSDAENSPSPPNLSESDESDHENETAEEKRLRLARAYLRHVGVSEDANVSDEADASDGTEGQDEANDLLREHALQKTGKSTTYIADKFSQALQKATTRRCKGHALSPTCIALSRDGETTAVSGGKDSRLIVWDVETGKRNFVFKPNVEKRHKRNPARADGHIGNILTVAVTDDAKLAVSGGDDGLIRVWDIRAGKLIEILRGHRGPVHGLAFRLGSRQLFSASKDRTVKIWDMNDLAYVETLFGHGGEVNSVSSQAMERALSSGRDGTLRLYKVVEGSQLVFRRALTMSIDAVAMVNENRFFSGGDDGAVCLWQTNKKKPTAVIENAHGTGLSCDAWISAVSAFRNTDLVVSGAGDGALRFWKCEDVPRLHSMGEMHIGPGFVNGIALGQRHGVMAAVVGSEHRLGRWMRLKQAKNAVHFVSIPGVD